MTERKLKLLSEIIQEKDDEIAAYQDKTAKQANEIAKQANEIAEKDKIISILKEQLSNSGVPIPAI